MGEDTKNKEFMWVATVDDAANRGNVFTTKIEIETLADNMTLFLSQIEKILEKTPDTVQKFQLIEFEVDAQISAKGQLVLLGTGGEIGGSGGLKFVFRKVAVPVSAKPQSISKASSRSPKNSKRKTGT